MQTAPVIIALAVEVLERRPELIGAKAPRTRGAEPAALSPRLRPDARSREHLKVCALNNVKSDKVRT